MRILYNKMDNEQLTPKEKANELVNTFRMILMNEDTDCGNEILCTMIAIKHSEICVDEVMELIEMIEPPYEGCAKGYQYFLKVRHELSLL